MDNSDIILVSEGMNPKGLHKVHYVSSVQKVKSMPI